MPNITHKNSLDKNATNKHSTNTPTIIHSDESQEYYFEEGCYILELANSDMDAELSIARARVLPNTETKLHKLSNTIERYIILSGEGIVQLGKAEPGKTEPGKTDSTELEERHVTSNDVVIIPSNCPQAIRNIGNDDLVFLVICTPRFIPENYSDC